MPHARAITPKAYRRLREQVGSQTVVARLLGVTKQAISDRERGVYRITREAELALCYVAQVAKS